MLNDWFRTVELPMSAGQFESLPRHPAYHYEYAGGCAILEPSPRYGRALLDLSSLPVENHAKSSPQIRPFQLRRLLATDWDLLAGLMSSAFHDVPPFCSLDETTCLAAAADCIRTTRTGGDGPVVHEACMVAVGEAPWESPVGAVLITLIPRSDLTEWHGTRWDTKPGDDALEKRLGRPHLTWIFVSPWCCGHGLGSALLRSCASILRGMGYTELASTFLIGNDRSLAWHWRNGFQLLQHPGSPRRE